MKIHHGFSRSFLYTSLLISALAAGSYVYADEATSGADNLKFSGQLVAQPCIIGPGNESLEVDFHSIIDTSLYLHERSYPRPFSVILSECDLSVGKSVRVSFSGNKSLALPGLLAVNTDSSAAGIAIGLETASGSPLPLGKETSEYQLKEGENSIDFRAYIQAEPDAITNKSIVLGPFTATATFYLEYE